MLINNNIRYQVIFKEIQIKLTNNKLNYVK